MHSFEPRQQFPMQWLSGCYSERRPHRPASALYTSALYTHFGINPLRSTPLPNFRTEVGMVRTEVGDDRSVYGIDRTRQGPSWARTEVWNHRTEVGARFGIPHKDRSGLVPKWVYPTTLSDFQVVVLQFSPPFCYLSWSSFVCCCTGLITKARFPLVELTARVDG